MPEDFEGILSGYDFTLPPELIAQAPASPRDSARLLVFDRKTGKRDWVIFSDIIRYLPKGSVLVLNKTKVIPARLHLRRDTGGIVAVLSLGIISDRVRVLSSRRLRLGEKLSLGESMSFIVRQAHGKEWLLEPSFPAEELQSILEQYGTMPLPPYIKHSPLSEDELKREYQTVFAKEAGSIAAPTASLHFTDALLRQIEESGITLAYLTLHVHLGTFAKLTEEQWKTGALHEETYEISNDTAATIRKAKAEGRPVIAVGTTVVRTLESAAQQTGSLLGSSGTTSLFIREGYRFHVVDGLLTNFHVPRSSLLMLVAALTGKEALMDLYREAIQKEMRFYSFGDAMLIL